MKRIKIKIGIKMNESNQNPRRYKWPWFVLAAVCTGFVALAIVVDELRREARERGA
jgi:hypothetical protein